MRKVLVSIGIGIGVMAAFICVGLMDYFVWTPAGHTDRVSNAAVGGILGFATAGFSVVGYRLANRIADLLNLDR